MKQMDKKDGMSKTVTVVIPIYNVEKYLNRCIESVAGQTYKNLEIILVDDESPDNCPRICEDWKNRDNRIKVIHKKNGGLGYARNTGIDCATGEYICFVDSDDYIAADMVEKTYKCAKQYNADIVLYGYNVVDSNGKKVKECIPKPYKTFYKNEEIQNYVLPNMIATDPNAGDEFWMSMCGGLFSMQLIRRANWRLVSERDIISEDVYSLLQLYNSVKSVAFLAEPFYYYCANMGSLPHTLRVDRYEKIKDFYDRAINECEKLGYSEEVKRRLSKPYMDNTMAALKMVLQSDLITKQKKDVFMDIVKDEHLHKVIKSVNMRKMTLKKRLFWLAVKYKIYYMSYFMVEMRI